MRTANPALSDKVFQNAVSVGQERMTIQGTVNKSLLLILIVMAAAYYTWQSAFPSGWSEGAAVAIPIWYLPVVLLGFVLSIVIISKKELAPSLAPLYALLEGGVLGAISAIFEVRYPGIVLQAVLGTMGTFLTLLLVYKSGLIKATDNFKLGVVAATGGIAIIYLISIVMSFFGQSMPLIHESSPIGIGFSVFVVIIAALNLVLDFDFIEKGAQQGAPKYMEWYGAFGLLVTLIWLYLEILRLLGKSKRR